MAKKKMKIVPGARQYTTGSFIVPPDNDGYEKWTFTIPNGVAVGSFVEAGTTNESNTSCGSYKMYMKRPDGTLTEKSFGTQPGCVSPTQVGQWTLFIKTVEPCVNAEGKTLGLKIDVRY